MFVAIRRDNGATVRRPTARELHDEMVRDYAARPVLRDPTTMGERSRKSEVLQDRRPGIIAGQATFANPS
jgi:hypothetical protein